jgi:BarA-like signal transduction histidine kinase
VNVNLSNLFAVDVKVGAVAEGQDTVVHVAVREPTESCFKNSVNDLPDTAVGIVIVALAAPKVINCTVPLDKAKVIAPAVMVALYGVST